MATKMELEKEKEEAVKEASRLKEENKILSEKVDSIEAMFKKLMEAQNAPVSKDEVANDVKNQNIEVEIKDNEYITVISLIDQTLNLTTELYGKGKTFTFTKFGHPRKIQYAQLADIIHVNEKFLKNGCFLILDDRVNMAHGLNEILENVLDKSEIERIINSDDKASVNLFISASESQKDYIIELFVKTHALLPEEEIDYNKVRLFSKYSGLNVEEKMIEYKTLK